MIRLRRRRLRALRLRARRGLGRHYVSLLSATVLAVAASQALMGSGFEGDGKPARGSPAQTEQSISEPAGAVASRVASNISAPSTIASVTQRMQMRAKQRRLALVYLVMSDAQGREVVQTYRTLIWDIPAPDLMQPVTVHYLVADTLEAEAEAVQLLNGLATFVNQHEVDLRIIDIRPDRRPANTGAP